MAIRSARLRSSLKKGGRRDFSAEGTVGDPEEYNCSPKTQLLSRALGIRAVRGYGRLESDC